TKVRVINIYNILNPLPKLSLIQLTSSDAKDIPLLLSGNIYLDHAQQKQTLDGEFAQNIFDTAKFLKGQGKVDQLKADYKSNVNSSFLQP
ncbi:hypothetical protein ACFMI7_18625, partial [Acinetobacter baumannii]